MVLNWREYEKNSGDRSRGVYIWTLPTFNYFPFHIGTARGKNGFAGRLDSAPRRLLQGQVSFVRKRHLIPAGREISHRAYMQLWKQFAQSAEVAQFMYVPSSLHPVINEDLANEGKFFFDQVRLLVCELPETQNAKFVEHHLQVQRLIYLEGIAGKFNPLLAGARLSIGGRSEASASAWSDEDELFDHRIAGRDVGSSAQFFSGIGRALQIRRAS